MGSSTFHGCLDVGAHERFDQTYDIKALVTRTYVSTAALRDMISEAKQHGLARGGNEDNHEAKLAFLRTCLYKEFILNVLNLNP